MVLDMTNRLGLILGYIVRDILNILLKCVIETTYHTDVNVKRDSIY
jgi:hypothetical protein